MSNLATHEAEQRAITEQWENCRADLTPCERAQQIMDETAELGAEDHDYQNRRRAARIALAILPAYDDDTAEQGIEDAITDLMHLCDLVGWDFAQKCEAGRRNYLFEINELGQASDDALRIAIERN